MVPVNASARAPGHDDTGSVLLMLTSWQTKQPEHLLPYKGQVLWLPYASTANAMCITTTADNG